MNVIVRRLSSEECKYNTPIGSQQHVMSSSCTLDECEKRIFPGIPWLKLSVTRNLAGNHSSPEPLQQALIFPSKAHSLTQSSPSNAFAGMIQVQRSTSKLHTRADVRSWNPVIAYGLEIRRDTLLAREHFSWYCDICCALWISKQ